MRILESLTRVQVMKAALFVAGESAPNAVHVFSTSETAVLSIIKRSGATEPFSREKVINGVRKACQNRPVDDDDLALLAMRVEEALRSTGQAEIEAQEVGMAILPPLRELDEVAYLRYASVYRNFSSLEDFEGEIALLRALPIEKSEIESESQVASPQLK